MRDSCGRTIDYLRLSVTDLCNYRCQYCMPPEGVEKRLHSDILSIEELAEIAAAKIASKNVLGIRLAVKKAALSIPVPKLCPRSMSRTSPITLPSMVMTIMRPTVFM